MEPRRIILLGLPQMLRDIVRSVIADQPDLDVVADLDGGRDLDRALQAHRPDFVIADRSCTEGRIERLVERSQLRLLEVEADGSRCFLSELRPHRVALGEISPDRLLRTIRT